MPPHAQILQLTLGGMICGAISCLARLGIPDLLEAGPKSAEEIAPQAAAHPVALYRLMRATASVGVLSEGPDGKFSQTPMSAALCSNANPSLRAWAILVGTDWHHRSWADLTYCVQNNKQALEHLYGQSTVDYIFKDPERGENFHESMTNLSMMDSPAVAASYSFEGINSIVDVAGGLGLLLATILQRNPRMKGTLYEIPQVIEGAKTGPLKPFLDRCTIVSGDMFTSVPAGADAYIMKHIIHDWTDDLCLKILTGCRKGVKPGGKLLVVDAVIRPGNDFDSNKFLDLEMLLFPGGHERTEKQFQDLFAAAGWRLNRVIPTPANIDIVEGVPA